MNKGLLPEKLRGVDKISKNLWWSWNREDWEIFRKINPSKWEVNRNPVSILGNAKTETLETLVEDEKYIKQVQKVEQKLDNYLNSKKTWFNSKCKKYSNMSIAYFSAEYGIHESLPIYSGGLGVLSGDHVKSASDLGVPIIFVGLFYKDGYFTQQINQKGKQVDVYKEYSPESLPLEIVKDKSGEEILIDVDINGKKVSSRVWEVKVGRCSLYLLDSNVKSNSAKDRQLTARLYGGDREMRISQEIILGIGGVRLLEKLDIKPDVYHMNEGHSGFFQLERIRQMIDTTDLDFEQAAVLCSSNCVFTTHTPVPAGNEAFSLPLMHKHFYNYAVNKLKISWDRFLDIGMVDESSDYKYFSLTVLAIQLSRFQNGVSELHGKVAKKMWRDIWPDVPEYENSISHITNGVHVQTWTAPEVKELFRKSLGKNWEENIINEPYWDKINNVSNDKIRETRQELKAKMITLVRKHLKKQLKRNGEKPNAIKEVDTFLRDDVLTIGFARRFATYKRATLIFQDLKKLATICNNKKLPVQFIFAGKAHPADVPGQKMIEEIYKVSRRPEFRGKIIILENYDMNISRHMVAGVDVWLNNPRRPMEASGTSGQKVPLNLGMNFSVLDGWWREGYDGKNGWSIGFEKDYPSDDIQDIDDALDFYKTLKDTIVPLYYKDLKKGVTNYSDAWLNKAKISLLTNLTRFSAKRMVVDYVQNLYIPAYNYGKYFQSEVNNLDNYLATYNKLQDNWAGITFLDVSFDKNVKSVPSKYRDFHNAPAHHVGLKLNDTLPGKVFKASKSDVELSVYVGEIEPSDIKCELIAVDAKSDTYEEVITLRSTNRKNGEGVLKFKGQYVSSNKKAKFLRLRILPVNNNCSSKFEFGLVTWL